MADATTAAAGETWEQLAAGMRGCVACAELAATRDHVVVGTRPDGAAAAMLIGEAPGATEDQTGTPFAGAAGRLLDQLLEEVGLPRARVAVANVLKCRPPANRAPSRVEVANCRGWLTAQIKLIDPPVICALGLTAARWFFGPATKIGELRGAPHVVDGRVVVVTYHPSAAIRFGPAGMPRAALRADLAALLAYS